MKVTVKPILVKALGTVPKNMRRRRFSKVEIRAKIEDHRESSPVKISLNTVKSPGNLGRLVVSQTPLKNDQLKLM